MNRAPTGESRGRPGLAGPGRLLNHPSHAGFWAVLSKWEEVLNS